MYDKDIEVLATLYEKKDFKGASRALGLKEATLKGKIASLEERFGIRILAEDKGEPIFTRAGKSIAEDAIFIIKYSNTAIGKALHLEVEDGFFIKVGSSMLSPEKELLSVELNVHRDVIIALAGLTLFEKKSGDAECIAMLNRKQEELINLSEEFNREIGKYIGESSLGELNRQAFESHRSFLNRLRKLLS